MKKLLKTLVVGATICTSMAVGAFAALNQEEIKAYMDYGITIKLDGQVKTLTNASGDRQYPIRYKGTTYVPLRAVSDLVGLPVAWDGATDTVLLGNNGSNAKVDLTTLQTTVIGKKAGEYNWIIRNSEDLKVAGDDAYMYFKAGIKGNFDWQWGLPKDQALTFPTQGMNTLSFSAWSDKNCTLYVCNGELETLDTIQLKANQVVEREISIRDISDILFSVGSGAVKYGEKGTIKILDPVIYNK